MRSFDQPLFMANEAAWAQTKPQQSSSWVKATAELIARGEIKQRRESEKVIFNALLIDLKSCSMRRDLQWGRRIHFQVVGSRYDSNVYVVTALIRMYGKCGSMLDARRVFDSVWKPDVVCWNVLLLGYIENGDGLVTLELFSSIITCGCIPSSVTYIAALKACTSLTGKQHGREQEWLERGKQIHSQMGCEMEISVRNTLINMYSKYGNMVEARLVFDSLRNPTVVSWNALLMGYADNGDWRSTLDLFSMMKGCVPDSVTFIAAIKACTPLTGKWGDRGEWLKRGREIHSVIGLELDIFVQSALIDMYRKCGSMVDAHHVFDSIQNPDVVCWTSLILGYAGNGDGLAALEMFAKMKACGRVPSSITYIAALKACTSLAGKRDGGGQGVWLIRGRQIHSEITFDLDIFVQSSLIDMYGKCGSMVDARLVFECIQNPNVVSWNALLVGYAENADGLATLELFSNMKACGCEPDDVTYLAVLKACGLMGALVLGRKIHSEISEFTPRVVTCLIDFYSKCGSIIEAHEVFDAHSNARDVSTWTALLTGYAFFGDTVSVFNLFEAMQDQGFQPDAITFVCLLSCCSYAGHIEKAREYFEAMHMQYRVTPTVMHYTCIVDILGRANQLNEAITVIRKMPCNPNVVTWTTLLGACRKWKNIDVGRCAFQSLLDMDKKNAAAYVLMAHIYGSREQERKDRAWHLESP